MLATYRGGTLMAQNLRQQQTAHRQSCPKSKSHTDSRCLNTDLLQINTKELERLCRLDTPLSSDLGWWDLVAKPQLLCLKRENRPCTSCGRILVQPRVAPWADISARRWGQAMPGGDMAGPDGGGCSCHVATLCTALPGQGLALVEEGWEVGRNPHGKENQARGRHTAMEGNNSKSPQQRGTGLSLHQSSERPATAGAATAMGPQRTADT